MERENKDIDFSINNNHSIRNKENYNNTECNQNYDNKNNLNNSIKKITNTNESNNNNNYTYKKISKDNFNNKSNNVKSIEKYVKSEENEDSEANGYGINDEVNNFRLKKLQKSRDNIKESIYLKEKNKDLEKTISNLVKKELSKCNDERNIRNNDNFNNLKTMNSSYNYNNQITSIDDNKVLSFELEHLKQENITLRNDNLILREDVNRLNEIGASLENELDFSRRKNLELIHENEKLGHEIDQRELEVNKLNEAISRLNFYENPGIAYTLEQKYLLENKIRELEKENRVLIEDKGKVEVEYKITNERYNDIKSKFDEFKSKISITKLRDNEILSSLENKINSLKESNDVYKEDNKILRNIEEKNKYELVMLRNDKERLEEKLNKIKMFKEELIKKNSLLENQNKELNYEKEYMLMERKKYEDERRQRMELKSQYIEHMRSSINNLKNMRSKSKNK